MTLVSGLLWRSPRLERDWWEDLRGLPSRRDNSNLVEDSEGRSRERILDEGLEDRRSEEAEGSDYGGASVVEAPSIVSSARHLQREEGKRDG